MSHQDKDFSTLYPRIKNTTVLRFYNNLITLWKPSNQKVITYQQVHGNRYFVDSYIKGDS